MQRTPSAAHPRRIPGSICDGNARDVGSTPKTRVAAGIQGIAPKSLTGFQAEKGYPTGAQLNSKRVRDNGFAGRPRCRKWCSSPGFPGALSATTRTRSRTLGWATMSAEGWRGFHRHATQSITTYGFLMIDRRKAGNSASSKKLRMWSSSGRSRGAVGRYSRADVSGAWAQEISILCAEYFEPKMPVLALDCSPRRWTQAAKSSQGEGGKSDLRAKNKGKLSM